MESRGRNNDTDMHDTFRLSSYDELGRTLTTIEKKVDDKII